MKFGILQITYWCSYGAFSCFMAAFMQSRGMSATLLGIMLTINTFCAFAGQFFWGTLCDRLKTNKKIFVVSNLLILLIQALIFSTESWTLIILTFGLLGFVQQPLTANLDTWILKTYKDTPQVYGPIRSAASVIFAVFTFFYGGILERNGYQLMLVCSGFFLIIGMVTAMLTPDVPAQQIHEQPKERGRVSGKILLRKKEYLLILSMLFGIGMASAPVVQMMAVIMENVGGTVAHVGYAMFISSIMQVPCLVFSGKLGKYPAKGRMIFAGLAYFTTVIGMSLVESPFGILVFCGLNGVGYGVLLPAMRELIFAIAPEELHTTAQAVADAVFNSLGNMVSSLLAGVLVDNFSVAVMLWVCGAVQMAAMAGFILKRDNGGIAEAHLNRKKDK